GNPLAGDRPLQVKGIAVNGKFRSLFAFHTAHHSTADGVKIGSYQLTYQDGQQAAFPIVYGEDVLDWWHIFQPNAERPRIGWTGANSESSIQFSVTRYDNPPPDKVVTSIDIYSTQAGACPCCVALTVAR